MKSTGDTTAVGEEMVRTIEIADYTPAWAEAFADLSCVLKIALGELALGIEHVGSTSVPGSRRRLSAAAELVGKSLVVNRQGNTIFFWKGEQRPHVLATGPAQEVQHRVVELGVAGLVIPLTLMYGGMASLAVFAGWIARQYARDWFGKVRA